jgi:uncharacterized membrane protein
VNYCPDDGLFRPKHVGNIVNTLYLINIVHLLELRHCTVIYKMHGKTHVKSEFIKRRTWQYILYSGIRKGIALSLSSQASPFCPTDKSNVNVRKIMELCWNDAERWKLEYTWKKLPLLHFVYY